VAGENLHLSMLLTAQAEQAKRELMETAKAGQLLGSAGAGVTTGWTGAKTTLDGAAAAAASVDRAVTSVTPKLDRLGHATSVNAMHSANLAAQFNDIGVMAMAMQNPLQLALQQGTQINQVFGQMGGHRTAIRALGPALLSVVNPASLATIAVIALGTMGVQWLLSMREEAVSVEDALKDLEGALTTLRDASKMATPAGLDEAEARYGRITAAVERLIAARERLALIDERAALDAAGAAVANRASGGMVEALLGFSQVTAGAMVLRRTLHLSAEDGARLYAEIQHLGQLHEPADLADQYALLAQQVEAVISAGNGSDELRQFLSNLLDAEDHARRIVAILETRGETDNRRADQMLADLQSELAIRQAINVYGEESTRVTELRIDAERRAFEEELRTLDVSDQTKTALREAWEAANGLAGVNMAAGIAAARDRAREMADEIARAVEGVQSLAQQGAGALEEARIRAAFADPIEQARRLAQARMLRAQAPLRNGAEGLDLAALDAQVRTAGNEAAEVARLNAERERLNRNRRDGTRASAQERKAVEDLIDNLQTEVDLLREADPVQQEMIRHREVLAAATAEERAQVEELIRAREREAKVVAEMDDLRDTGRDVLRGIVDDLRASASASDILHNALGRVLDRIVEIGEQRFLDWLLGARGTSSGGLLGGLLSALTGIRLNASGDVIGAPTLFAYGDKPGQLGVMGEAGPEAIMPLTHAGGQGVGAIVAGLETTLPLTRLASGKLGVVVPPAPQAFSLGGTFGYIPDPPRRAFASEAAATAAGYRAAPSVGDGNGGTVNNFYVTTPDAKSFESRATVARGARRLVGMSARYS